MTALTHIMPTGKPCTAKERRDFLIFFARLMHRELRARRGDKGNEPMRLWAANARREAAAIDVRPTQGVML